MCPTVCFRSGQRYACSVPELPDLTVYVERLADRLQALEDGAWAELRDAWYDHAPGARDSRVVVRRPGGPDVVGVARGIDDTGALRVEDGDGSILTVRSGESLVTKGA